MPLCLFAVLWYGAAAWAGGEAHGMTCAQYLCLHSMSLFVGMQYGAAAQVGREEEDADVEDTREQRLAENKKWVVTMSAI